MKKFAIGLIVVFLLSSLPVVAESLDGKEIMEKVDSVLKADEKYMEEEMILYTSSGTTRKRTVSVWNKRVDDMNKMLLRFNAPADIKGTGFLMEGDDMWLYLPALGREKRVAGSAKQGNFMGSDLTYEDMETLGNTGFSGDYSPTLLEKSEFNGRDAYLLKLIPEDEESAYSKLEMWVDAEIYLPLHIIYYDSDGEEYKQLTTRNHKELDGKWTATELEMKNLKKGTKTVLKVNEVDFNISIDDNVFTIRFLERGN
jgi:outer membrane lipoprotein-sorting protein